VVPAPVVGWKVNLLLKIVRYGSALPNLSFNSDPAAGVFRLPLIASALKGVGLHRAALAAGPVSFVR
jgi:hypothetical protein